jgi:hypothetical protein
VQGAFAVIAPILAAVFVAPWFGLNANNYLIHLAAACAVAAAVPLGLVANALLRSVSERWLLRPIEATLPFAAALIIALPGISPRATADDERIPTTRDLSAVDHILRDEHGWDSLQLVEHLKSPPAAAVLMELLQSRPLDVPGAATASGATNAVLVRLKTEELPEPLPSSWVVVSHSARAATVLAFTQSRLDWRKFEVCIRPADQSAEQCQETSWNLDKTSTGVDVPHMPPPGSGWRGMLTLRLPLRSAEGGANEEIFMPHIPGLCGGRIIARSGDASVAASDGRHAIIAATEVDREHASTIELEWDIGSPECNVWAYDGLPPFVVAGDTANVRPLESIFRKIEG